MSVVAVIVPPGVGRPRVALYKQSLVQESTCQVIRRHGLDWTRTRAARGIIGSHRSELNVVFLCLSEFDVDCFVQMYNTGVPVDVLPCSVSERPCSEHASTW